jgi:hypothetical protein
MRRLLACLFVSVLAVGVLHAQGDSFTPADFEAFIKKDLKKEFKKREKDDDFVYDIAGSFHVLFAVKERKLLFYEQYVFELPKQGKKMMADKLKKWNDKGGLSHIDERGYRFLEGSGGSLHTVRFAGTFDISKGVDKAKLKEFHDKLDLEFEGFVVYMQDLLKHDKKKSIAPPKEKDK